MRRRYFFAAGEISDSTRHPQHTLMRARRQIKSLGGGFQQRPAGLACRARPVHFRTLESGIIGTATLQLHVSGRLYSPLNSLRGFAGMLSRSQLFRRRAQDLDMQINTVQQRPRNPATVSGASVLAAAAIRKAVPEETARARIHRRDELKVRRVLCLTAST
jgi:hypothetical protein